MLNAGHFADAESLALKITSHFPLWGHGWTALGIALKQMGRSTEALKPMQNAVKLLPGIAEAYSNLGTVQQELGQLDEAEANCRSALAIKPNFSEGHNNLGLIQLDLGKLDEAEASFRRALAIRPNSAAAHFNLHTVLLGSGSVAPAIACLEQAVGFDPSNDKYRFFLGMLLDYTGNAEAAEKQFQAVTNNLALHRARLDAWQHLKSAGDKLPSISGSSAQAFRLGTDIAANDGLVLEFGVRFGTSIRQIAALVPQEVHGFDSFEGLPEHWHDEPKTNYSTNGVIPKVAANVRLYPGWFDATLPEFLKNHPGPVRFMNIDCDIYSSTKTVLDLLSDRIIGGTVIVFDEYIGNEHWRDDEFKAFQEAVSKYGWRYRYVSFSFFTKQVVVQLL